MRNFLTFALLALVASPSDAQVANSSYTYDELGRLKRADYQSGHIEYAYDPNGNRTTVSTLAAPYVITGTSGNDVLLGTFRDEQLNALDGDDLIGGGGGNDAIDGGPGWDTTFHAAPSDYSFVRQGNGTVWVTQLATGQKEILSNVEGAYFLGTGELYPVSYLLVPGNTVNGTSGPDVINGTTTGVDRIYGLGGDDVFAGYGGVDVIDGGPGWDNAFFGGALSNYSMKWVTIGAVPNAGVQITYVPSGESELLIGIEGAYFAGSADWLLISQIP